MVIKNCIISSFHVFAPIMKKIYFFVEILFGKFKAYLFERDTCLELQNDA